MYFANLVLRRYDLIALLARIKIFMENKMSILLVFKGLLIKLAINKKRLHFGTIFFFFSKNDAILVILTYFHIFFQKYNKFRNSPILSHTEIKVYKTSNDFLMVVP